MPLIVAGALTVVALPASRLRWGESGGQDEEGEEGEKEREEEQQEQEEDRDVWAAARVRLLRGEAAALPVSVVLLSAVLLVPDVRPPGVGLVALLVSLAALRLMPLAPVLLLGIVLQVSFADLLGAPLPDQGGLLKDVVLLVPVVLLSVVPLVPPESGNVGLLHSGVLVPGVLLLPPTFVNVEFLLSGMPHLAAVVLISVVPLVPLADGGGGLMLSVALFGAVLPVSLAVVNVDSHLPVVLLLGPVVPLSAVLLVPFADVHVELRWVVRVPAAPLVPLAVVSVGLLLAVVLLVVPVALLSVMLLAPLADVSG